MGEAIQAGMVGVMAGMVDATSSEVRIKMCGGTSRMIPPIPAHVRVDVELTPTTWKWTTISYQKTESTKEGEEGKPQKGGMAVQGPTHV